MHFECRPVDSTFFETAAMCFRNVVELDASSAQVFAIFEDADSWPQWFPGMKKVLWTSNRPYGVGATRTVELAAVTVYEHFFRWEANRRLSFYFTGHSRPLAHALAEDYLLEEVSPGRTRFTYTVGMTPRLPVAIGGPLSRMYFGAMFRNGAQGLRSYILKTVAPAGGRSAHAQPLR